MTDNLSFENQSAQHILLSVYSQSTFITSSPTHLCWLWDKWLFASQGQQTYFLKQAAKICQLICSSANPHDQQTPCSTRMELLHLSCTPSLQAGAEMKGQGAKQHWFSQNWDHNYLPVEPLTAPSSVLMQVTTSFDDA